MRIQSKYIVILSFVICLNTFPSYAEDSNNYTLQQATDYALSNNPNLQIMQDRIGQAQAQLGEALANFYPQFKAQMSYEHSDNPAALLA